MLFALVCVGCIAVPCEAGLKSISEEIVPLRRVTCRGPEDIILGISGSVSWVSRSCNFYMCSSISLYVSKGTSDGAMNQRSFCLPKNGRMSGHEKIILQGTETPDLVCNIPICFQITNGPTTSGTCPAWQPVFFNPCCSVTTTTAVVPTVTTVLIPISKNADRWRLRLC